MCSEIYPGTCILLPKPGSKEKHLWIVLTEPDEELNVVIVNLTTRRSGSDTTVILNQGDHPFIRHPTVVHYSDARKAPAKALQQIANRPEYDYHDDLEDEILERIKEGLFQSQETKPAIRDYCLRRLA